MKTAYSYIRFSSVAQEKGDSLRRQTQLRDEWLKAHPEYKLDTDHKIDDLGTSAFRGKNIKKGGLRTFLEHVERGDVEPGSVLLVEKLDRYSRDMAHVSSGHLASLVTEHDIAVVPFTGMLAGRFIDKAAIEKDQSVFLQIVLSFQIAHGESAGKSERNAAAQAGKRERAKERGEIMTSQVPAWINVTGAATKDAGHNAALSLNVSIVSMSQSAHGSFAKT